ncbi:hypothetical protein, partial [Hymenobacter agri]
AGAAAARRQAGEADLGMKGLAYQDQMRGQLRRDLGMASQRRQRDLDTYNANKAALTQASAQNMSSAIDTAGSYGMLGLNMYQNYKAGQGQGDDAAIGADKLSPKKIGLDIPGYGSARRIGMLPRY